MWNWNSLLNQAMTKKLINIRKCFRRICLSEKKMVYTFCTGFDGIFFSDSLSIKLIKNLLKWKNSQYKFKRLRDTGQSFQESQVTGFTGTLNQMWVSLLRMCLTSETIFWNWHVNSNFTVHVLYNVMLMLNVMILWKWHRNKKNVIKNLGIYF